MAGAQRGNKEWSLRKHQVSEQFIKGWSGAFEAQFASRLCVLSVLSWRGLLPNASQVADTTCKFRGRIRLQSACRCPESYGFPCLPAGNPQALIDLAYAY